MEEPKRGILKRIPADTSVFTLTEENAYAIYRDDGRYDLYLYGEYIETVDSLKGYDSSLPILTNKENTQ